MSLQTDRPAAVRPNLLSEDPPALLGGSCAACGGLSFPVAPFCAYCGEPDPPAAPLSTTGVIYSFTIARFAPPGYTGAMRIAHVMARAATQAYEAAGLGPQDLDVCELQDTDASTEIIATEHVGLCGPGEGGALVASGATSLGGRIPVNPSGGLLSKGEPVGASALGQVYEIVRQLRGLCGPRQVQGARAGLSLALGAGGNCSALVFRRA